MHLSRSTRKGERGAAALSLLTVGMIMALGIFAAIAVPLTQASDGKAKSRTAADAAALAGVESVKNDLTLLLTSQGWPGGWDLFDVGSGLPSATSYADRNKAVLVTYQAPTLLNGWTSYAKVKSYTHDNEVVYSEARAQFDLPECHKKDAPTPTGPTPTPDPDDPPPPPTPDTFVCGGIEFDVPTDGSLPDLSRLINLLDTTNAKLIS